MPDCTGTVLLLFLLLSLHSTEDRSGQHPVLAVFLMPLIIYSDRAFSGPALPSPSCQERILEKKFQFLLMHSGCILHISGPAPFDIFPSVLTDTIPDRLLLLLQSIHHFSSAVYIFLFPLASSPVSSYHLHFFVD